jgi:hypothetical protein
MLAIEMFRVSRLLCGNCLVLLLEQTLAFSINLVQALSDGGFLLRRKLLRTRTFQICMRK